MLNEGFVKMFKPYMSQKRIHRDKGFTLVEMLAVIIITAVVGAVAIPQFGTLRGSMDRINARAYIIQDLKRAQAESITQGCRGIFKIAANNESYTFGCDYLTYDVAADPSADVTSFVRNLPTDIEVSADAAVIFNSRGQAIDTSYALTNVDISITDDGTEFASGTISGSGVFSYD